MKLTRIKIENFRSIKSQTLTFDYDCQILLGKNEAGKSNVLKAIAAVFGKYKVSDKDKRKRVANESINRYFIYASIKLEDNDFNEVLTRFINQFKNTDVIIFKNSKKLIDLIKTVFYELILWIEIGDNNSSYFSYWKYEEKTFELEQEVYRNETVFSNEEKGTKHETVDIVEILFDIVKKLYNKTSYRCHYWEHSNSFLLPNQININEFILAPDKCEPLRNIFIACNIKDIKKEFADALSQDGDYRNLFVQVSKEITNIFQTIWKDFKDTAIEIIENGPDIKIKLANKSSYSFEDRSDGFRKFINILLMISTKAISKNIGERDIILIDEPDQSLYPTSAEYLRDELIQVSKTSRIIYATHSPYMIDSNNIERHLIVEKKDDVTTINKQELNAPYYNDELLRRAIGTSIFDVIKPRNIIFEGWLDKELFCKYISFHRKIKYFDNIGIVYLAGISGVDSLVQLLILANKKFIIVSDSDDASNSKRKEFVLNYGEFISSWLSYGDIVPEVITMEDFISTDNITRYLKKEMPDFIYDSSRKVIENIDNVVKNDKERKKRIKNSIIKELDKKDITKGYDIFFDNLMKKIEEI